MFCGRLHPACATMVSVSQRSRTKSAARQTRLASAGRQSDWPASLSKLKEQYTRATRAGEPSWGPTVCAQNKTDDSAAQRAPGLPRTTFQSQQEMMDAVSWKRISSTRRDWQGLFPFFRADAPTSTVSTAWGVFEDVVLLDSASPAHLICVTLHSTHGVEK